MSQLRTFDTEMELHESHLSSYSKAVKPIHYKINLKTDLVSTKFEGHVVVQLQLTEAVQEIYFHSYGLKFHEIAFRTNADKYVKPAKVVELEHDEMVKLVFDQKLESGNGFLELKYEGVMNDKQKGFYLNKFYLKNEEHYFGVTHFEPYGARMVFPCFDEPEFKAYFELTLQIPTHYDAIFNSIEVDNGKVTGPYKTISFTRTPLMSTHHLSFVIGKFEYKEVSMVEGVRMRLYMPYGVQHYADFSKEIFEKLFRCCCRCFHTSKYPLTKLDLIMMPNYRFDGVGNLGLIYVNEDLLKLDTYNRKNEESFVHERQEIALLLAHTLIRQWMDNLCTIRFFTEHWFNEGFAHFFKYLVVDKVYPEWKVMQHFNDKEVTPAMFGDMFYSGHPLEREHYGHFDEHHFYHHDGSKMHGQKETKSHEDRKLMLNNYYYYDSNTVHKSASIFRMIYQFVGENNFYNALLKYQKEYAFKTVTTNDFFDLLELESHKPIRTIVQTWTHKKGFPIVEVEGKLDKSGNYILKLKQKSVLKYAKPTFDKLEYHDDELFNHWVIPVTICTAPVIEYNDDKKYAFFTEQEKEKCGMFDIVLNKEQVEVTIPEDVYKKSGGFFHVNPYHLGHFVTHYVDDVLAKKVFTTYNQKTFAENKFDRFGLLFDTYNLVKVGVYPVNYYFDMVKQYATACHDEKMICTSTWKFIFKSFYEIRNILINYDYAHKDGKFTEHLYKFAHFIVNEVSKKLFYGKYDIVDLKLAMATETGVDKYWRHTLRGELVRFMVTFHHPELFENAKKTFWSFYEKRTPVDRDLLWSTFVAVAMTNDEKVLETFFKIYQNTELNHLKQHVIWAFGYFTKKDIVEKIMHFALTQKYVTKEESVEILKSLARWFPVGRDLTWELFKAKFNEHFEKHYDSDFLAFNLIEKIMETFENEKSVNDVMEFFAHKSYPYLESILYKYTEYVHIKSEFFKRDYDVLQKYLANY